VKNARSNHFVSTASDRRLFYFFWPILGSSFLWSDNELNQWLYLDYYNNNNNSATITKFRTCSVSRWYVRRLQKRWLGRSEAEARSCSLFNSYSKQYPDGFCDIICVQNVILRLWTSFCWDLFVIGIIKA